MCTIYCYLLLLLLLLLCTVCATQHIIDIHWSGQRLQCKGVDLQQRFTIREDCTLYGKPKVTYETPSHITNTGAC